MSKEYKIAIYIGTDEIGIPVNKDDTAKVVEKRINIALKLYQEEHPVIGSWSAKCELEHIGIVDMASKNQ